MADDNGEQKITVGEKEYTPEELTQAIQQGAEAQSKLEGFKAVQEAADLFQVSPDQFVNEARGAIGALVQLQEAGLIDKNGKIVERAPSNPPKSDDPPTGQAGQASPAPSNLSADEIAAQVLEKTNPTIKELKDTVSLLKTSMNRIYRDRIQDTVKSKGIEVEDEDIHLALAESQRSGKDFWDILDGRAERRKNLQETAVKRFAEEHGLNLEELNKLREAKADEGKLAHTIVEGKTLSRKKGGNNISALDATKELIKRRLG